MNTTHQHCKLCYLDTNCLIGTPSPLSFLDEQEEKLYSANEKRYICERKETLCR